MMGLKTRQVNTDPPKAEVGEIDTRAPFESVKAAVSLFGEVAFSADRSAARKPKPQSAEKAFTQETQFHVVNKELCKLKEQLCNAETTRVEALTELDNAKKTVEVLTRELSAITASKELALKATEAAKGPAKQLEEDSSSDGTGKDGAWKQELGSIREQYAAATTELDAAKKELRRIRKDFDASMDAKACAYQQDAEAKKLSNVSADKAIQLSKDITSVQESLVHVKLATEQAQQEELKIRSEKDAKRQSYKQALEETEKKLSSIKKDFDPELIEKLEMKLAETEAEIGFFQKEMQDARVSELESVKNVTIELNSAKEVLRIVAEEENSFMSLMESLKLELEAVRKEHSELKDKETEVEYVVGNLHVQLAKCKAELEAAVVSESKAGSASDDLTSTLQQLSAESEVALEEAEAMKRNAEELRHEAEAARIALAEAEKKLHAALSDAEEAKAAEAKALNQIKELSDKATASRASTSEHGANITISKEEFDSLSQKVVESEKLAEMKVSAGMAQVEAVRASEKEAIKRLEAIREEMEDMATATEAALKKAEMAEAAKKAVEGELTRWREKEQKKASEEQKKASEAASRILAEAHTSKEQLALKITTSSEAAETVEKVEVARKVYKPSATKKSLFPSLSSIFQRRKGQVDGGVPSYLPGENPV